MIKFKRKVVKELMTLQRHRIGNFELRISETKVEIEDIVQKLTKHVYGIGSYEYGLLSHLLSPWKHTEGKDEAKTRFEIDADLKNVEFLVIMLAHTNLLFSSEPFRLGYYKLMKDLIVAAEPDKEDRKEDDEILEEMKMVDEMENELKKEE